MAEPVVTGIIVEPTALAGDRRLDVPAVAKDSITTVKTAETIEADRTARSNEVDAAILRTAGQRRVNMIWEYTQAAIAVSVVVACIAAAFFLDPARAEILRNAFFLIVGFYFGRTNHQTTGGIGTHEPLQQSGR